MLTVKQTVDRNGNATTTVAPAHRLHRVQWPPSPSLALWKCRTIQPRPSLSRRHGGCSGGLRRQCASAPRRDASSCSTTPLRTRSAPCAASHISDLASEWVALSTPPSSRGACCHPAAPPTGRSDALLTDMKPSIVCRCHRPSHTRRRPAINRGDGYGQGRSATCESHVSAKA